MFSQPRLIMANANFLEYCQLNTSIGNMVIPVFEVNETLYEGILVSFNFNVGDSFMVSVPKASVRNIPEGDDYTATLHNCNPPVIVYGENDFNATFEDLASAINSYRLVTVNTVNTLAVMSTIYGNTNYYINEVLCVVFDGENYGFTRLTFDQGDESSGQIYWLMNVYPIPSSEGFGVISAERITGAGGFNRTIYYIEDATKIMKAGTPVTPPGPEPTETDPYAQGGTSGGGGGTGTFSRTGDTIGEHDLPTLSAVDAGFITLFAPTRGEMKSLASYLWSDLFSLDTFKKIFANPMDAILGLSIVPVQVPTSGSKTVKVGNISTGVSMTKASTQYVKLSCGSLQVEEYWGAYLDYSPYTKCEIYLPYIGVHELSIDDVMGKTIKVVYYLDILSGACTAEIYSEGTCLYSFVGQCSASIPISGNDWTNVINGVMQIGAAVGSLVASGGLSAPISGGMLASGLKTGASVGGTVTASKPSVERSGSMSGAGGMLGQQNPYLIITWPKECIPASQNKFIGYPSFVTVTLGDITGFNIVESVHLENIPATSEELDEIESLLMNGVIF